MILERNTRIRASKSYSNEMGIYVPCINCNTHILFADIGKYIYFLKIIKLIIFTISDKHSEVCTNVKKEVFEVDMMPDEIKSINYKLFKLEENLKKIKNQHLAEEADGESKYKKEEHYILTLLQYVSDSISNIF
jgi:hypothetical protein